MTSSLIETRALVRRLAPALKELAKDSAFTASSVGILPSTRSVSSLSSGLVFPFMSHSATNVSAPCSRISYFRIETFESRTSLPTHDFQFCRTSAVVTALQSYIPEWTCHPMMPTKRISERALITFIGAFSFHFPAAHRDDPGVHLGLRQGHQPGRRDVERIPPSTTSHD